MDEQKTEPQHDEAAKRPVPGQVGHKRSAAAWAYLFLAMKRLKIAGCAVGSSIDFRDVLYVVSICLMAFGAERAFGNGFGAFLAGALILIPILPELLIAKPKGPNK